MQDERTRWSFLTNHGQVLVCIAEQDDIRIRAIAARVDITERAVLRIIRDLERSGFVSHERIGRRNHYIVDLDRQSRHPLERHLDVNTLIRGSRKREVAL